MVEKALKAFDRWFTSSQGVWQTLVLTVAVVVLEAVFPHLDNHGFLLLYWMTVYSAVTQPVLAHSGKETSEQLAALQTAMQAVLERDLQVDQETHDLLKQIAEKVGANE